MRPHHKAKDRPPRWVKVFGALALAFVAIFAAIHLVGGGMGHLSHAGAPMEHSSHTPRS
jgi:hypothetical protein